MPMIFSSISVLVPVPKGGALFVFAITKQAINKADGGLLHIADFCGHAGEHPWKMSEERLRRPEMCQCFGDAGGKALGVTRAKDGDQIEGFDQTSHRTE